jgi:hypothetical protein
MSMTAPSRWVEPLDVVAVVEVLFVRQRQQDAMDRRTLGDRTHKRVDGATDHLVCRHQRSFSERRAPCARRVL